MWLLRWKEFAALPEAFMRIRPQTLRIGAAVVVILGTIAYLAITAVGANKSYYVTISELDSMGSQAYTRHLRVAGIIKPGSIQRDGTNANFVLDQKGRTLRVDYRGSEPPPDTFKDNAQALAVGTLGRNGVFEATEVQAKCASKYAPATNQAPMSTAKKAAPAPAQNRAELQTSAPAMAAK